MSTYLSAKSSFYFPKSLNSASVATLMNRMDKMPALPRRTQSAGEELANSISHGMGFVAALIGRHRLYNRHIIFCERSPSLPPFRLASVCPCRHGLSLCGRAFPVS
jgi:hypothetical protein